MVDIFFGESLKIKSALMAMVKFFSLKGKISVYGTNTVTNIVQREIIWEFSQVFKYNVRAMEQFYFVLNLDEYNGPKAIEFFVYPYLKEHQHFLSEP